MVDFTEMMERISRPTIARKPWMEAKKFTLATAEMLPKIVDDCIASGLYALDLETTGLDNRVFNGATVDRIAGACLTPDGEVGYYIPVYHPQHMGSCISFSLFTREMRRLVKSAAVAIFHNGKFDQEFLQFNGGEPIGEWDEPLKWEDTLILAYLRDTRARNKGLKHLSKVELDMEMIELEDLFGEKEVKEGRLDFGTLDPTWEPALWYAASDAICTYLLYKRLRDAATKPTDTGLPSQEPIYVIEKLCVAATRWMERCRIPIDREMVKDLIRIGQREWLPALGDVYAEASKALGRDITPAYFKLLTGTNPRFRFDPEDVDSGIKENIDRSRVEADRRQPDDGGDPTESDSKGKKHVKTIQKRVPNLLDKKQLDTVNFPLVYDVLVPDQLGLLLRELGVEGLIATEKSGQVKTSKDVLDKVIEEAGEEFPYIKKIKRFREVAKAIASNLHPLYVATDPLKSPDGRIRVNFEAFKTDTARFSTPQERDGRGWTGKANWNIHSIPSGRKKDIPECLKRIREVIRAPKGKLLYACVAEGVQVPTTRGLLPIESVRVGDRVYTEEGPREVSAVTDNGIRQVVRLTTSSGYVVRLTPDHRVRVVGPGGFLWQEAGMLRPGDFVVLAADGGGVPAALPPNPAAHHRSKLQRTPKTVDVNLSDLLGRLMGDGCITGSKDRGLTSVSFALGSDVVEVLPHLNQQVEMIFGIPPQKANDDGTVVYASRSLARWLNEVTGKGDADVMSLQVPQSVLASGPECWGAFLRGLFDADGSVGTRRGDSVSLWVSSTRMAQQVHEMLLGLGILSVRKQITRVSNFGANTGWQFAVRGVRSLRLFQERVGFFTPRKCSALDCLLSARTRSASDFIPLALVRKALPCPLNGRGNAVVNNGRRHSRASVEGLSACRDIPGVSQEWMTLLLENPIRFDTVASVTVDGEARVYDLTVPEGSRFVAGGLVVHNCDYSGEELRVVTNLSREPLWEAEFFRCAGCGHTFDRGATVPPPPAAPPPFCPECGSDSIGDLHTLTTIALHGASIKESSEFKQKRNEAKGVNFALCYGGGGMAVVRSAGVTKDEGWRIKRQFDATYKGLSAWWERQYEYGRQTGFVLTAFNRRYPVPDITSADGGFRSKAERNAVNGPIQGTGSDIMKWAMGLIYREMKKRGWLDKVKAIITIHDELVFEIDDDVASEAVDVIVEIMLRKTVSKLAWRVPLTCDIEAGPTWTVPWNITKIRYGKQAMPPELAGVFTSLLTKATEPPGSGETGGGSDAPAIAHPQPEEPVHPTGDGMTPPPTPNLQQGADFVYTIRSSNLTMMTMARVASVINICRGRGQNTLKLVTETGESLWDGDPILVNAVEASVHLNMLGTN